MTILHGLKEIVEFEILDLPVYKSPSYDLDRVKSVAIKILQASKCHKGCVCNYSCGCAKTSECSRCNPPKRFLRVKTCPGGLPWELEVVEVSSRGPIHEIT